MKSKKFKYLDIIIDNSNSWMWSYIYILEAILSDFSDNVRVFKNIKDIKSGDILFILSCDRILKVEDLDKHKNNIVIHASDLPKGKGWSPWSWEIENGANFLTLTLFEAKLELDSGDWYLKVQIDLNASELINDIRKILALNEFEMIKKYLSMYPIPSKQQIGIETFYQKRTSKNQELDIDKSIKEQFNLLRICDNENYPAHFYINNKKYIIKIYKEHDQ
ncbi:MAG: methionyl-tRNA formyltransferase [Campylobacterales bacterium]|nr:methionyl-tRNA formyltransferase [Campylobacterales bacterium]